MATTEQQPSPAPAAGGPEGRGAPDRWRSPLAIVLGAAAALAAVSTLILLWARTRPGFDPYGWLVWGHQTVAGNLDTNAAPSWKPLPYLFTVPYGLFGHYQLWLWMITSLAISLAGAVFAGRIAYRLTGATPERRWPAIVAGLFAGLGLLGISDYWHYMLSAQSDPMIVALCLAAIDCHLHGRPRWAFVMGALAGLGRPEVWLFLGLYSAWAWRAVPSMRWLIVTGIVLMVLLWFGIPALTSRTPFQAGSNALGSGRRLRSDRVFGTIGRFRDLNPIVLELTALLAVVIAVVRRNRIALVVVIVAALVPSAVSHARDEHRDIRAQRARTAQIGKLSSVVARYGGPARFKACGEPLTRLEYQTILAWTLHLNVVRVGYKYGPAIASGRPIVLFTPLSHGGWKVQALHQRLAICESLPR